MKKILFLSFSYPYGHFGPSDQCTTRIMEALVRTGKYEVHNISYEGTKSQYPIIEGVHLHSLNIKESIHNRPAWLIRLLLLLKLPIYPYTQRFSSKRIYKKCSKIIEKEHFDLVVAQNNPEESVMVGDRLDNDMIPAKAIGMETVWIKNGLAQYQGAALGNGVVDYQIR